MIALFKAVHVMGLVVWCAGLIALPIIIQAYGRTANVRTQAGYSELRLLTHRGYVELVTPAAVIAVGAGTVLLFLAEIRDPWMMAKLAAIGGMAICHAWIGHMVALTGEHNGAYRLPSPVPVLLGAIGLMGLVLWLVLAKPDLAPLADSLPEWLRQPLGRELPSSLVPI
ncbi:CopD family protein [Pararhodobacter sp.]|uniref:CopD family protein n=1 Tax=Pararhodobacter sp. TaxID=2127056 RepID=UPI002FDE08E7